MDRVRNWLMHVIAGRKNAYWISDRAALEVGGMRSIPGEMGAVFLAKAMRDLNATAATFVLDGYRITIEVIDGGGE